MTRATFFALITCMSTVHAAGEVVVKGELSWNSNGFAKVAECGTKRVLEFVTMASAPYFKLRRRYEELSPNGEIPVLVEVRGVLRQSNKSDGQVIQYPTVLGLTKGRCEKPAA